MPNLYYHRMLEGFPEELYQAVSYAAGYSKRAFSLTKPEWNDHVLVDPCDGMDLSFPDLSLLNEQGIGPKPENVHVVNFDHKKNWKTNVNNNKNIFNALSKNNFNYIYPFTAKSSIAHNLSKALNIPIRCSSLESAYWAEDKKTLKDFSKLSVIPTGYKCNNNDELLKNWEKLITNKSYPGKSVVKASQTASGTVSSIIVTKEHLENYMNQFDLSKLDGGIIEEWFESDPRSPSINYFIYPDGKYKILFMSDQIFEDNNFNFGEEGTRIHRGNRSPSTIEKDILDEIIKLTDPLVKELIKNNYWGPVGFDTIVTDSKKVYITEINPRITGPHFGWRPAKNSGFSYFSMQNEKIKEDITFNELRKTVEEELYFPGKKNGFIMHNFFPGKFIGIVAANNGKELDEMKKKISEKLKKLKN